MNLISPNKLKKGDTIGIISPSAGLCGLFSHRVDNGVKMIEKLGFKIKFAKNSKNNSGYTSGTIEERVDDIHEMFLDSDVKCIICSIGGNHSNQLLKKINFDIVKDNPKIFIGYSDISVLHYAFIKKANLKTYYGPCLITEFGEHPEMLEYSQKYLLEAITKTKDIYVENINYYTDELLNWIEKEDLKRKRRLKEIEGFKWIKKGSASGQIIGGCVPSINHLIGTQYWVQTKNKIFFIDLPEGHEIGKGINIDELDSYLTDLDNIDVFDDIKGLLISIPYGFNTEQKNELEELLIRFTKNKNYPVGVNFPIGHSDPMITIPLLNNVRIESDSNTFVINQ